MTVADTLSAQCHRPSKIIFIASTATPGPGAEAHERRAPRPRTSSTWGLAVEALPKRSDEEGAARLVGGYPLRGSHRDRGCRGQKLSSSGWAALITFGRSPLLGYSETPCPAVAVWRQTAHTETSRRHVGRFRLETFCPLI